MCVGGGVSVEQLTDSLVHAAKEVHIGRPPVRTLVLHQELPESHLWLLSLLHDRELGNNRNRQASYEHVLAGLSFLCAPVTQVAESV